MQGRYRPPRSSCFNHLLNLNKVYTIYVGGSMLNFFRIFEIKIFCFVVAIFDLVQDSEAIFHLP